MCNYNKALFRHARSQNTLTPTSFLRKLLEGVLHHKKALNQGIWQQKIQYRNRQKGIPKITKILV